MSAVLRVTGDDLRYLSAQLNALADGLHSFPFFNVSGMPGCGSSSVATAADGANDHFELRSLLIETELRDLAALAVNVDTALTAQDVLLAAGGSGRINPGPV
jgi:hypothetical protein